ncbi:MULTISPECIES: nitrate reductase cytochrome c-type subunit [Halocynthiibacter]|uniref:Periplasmic nitrate reductase, electron transfer subunit n=1 Tax=Halocynthiibacter halioticoli TaxID=2986804 RepID=A0AAE3IYT5_9RHOB|nr:MULTISPECIES: nitrate reductase cytochrome c-type subunit [Halocynthiibacter]MCV6824797.1 nitrate reductase cytochrome c-type subunit [Halocynthiibacter halioticoli]MCW4057798.1 nitrate reductase cytochrome c-type subunit [Halocynthiibacter sp. SDUM655004]
MKLLSKTIVASALVVAMIGGAVAQESVATLRSGVALDENAKPPQIPAMTNNDLRQVRNYPEQPPLIPHKIEGYQIDINANKCLQCHSRSAIGESQAPMISITHFMNRDNQFLASVTPRRYFCTQCHVPQLETDPLVENTFVDVDQVLEYVAGQQKEEK